MPELFNYSTDFGTMSSLQQNPSLISHAVDNIYFYDGKGKIGKITPNSFLFKISKQTLMVSKRLLKLPFWLLIVRNSEKVFIYLLFFLNLINVSSTSGVISV